MRKVIYPGTFDPLTNGHVELIHRAMSLFDQVVVAVAISRDKEPYVALEDRLWLAREVLGGYNRVKVKEFSGLLVDFAREQKACCILRGLRGVSDFDYEFQLARMNRRMDKNLDTLFLPSIDSNVHISASIVREIFAVGGDVASFVPPAVLSFLKNRK